MRMQTFIKKLSIVDHLYFFMLAVVFVFYLLAFKKTPYKLPAILVLAGLAAMLAAMVIARGKNSFGTWQPVISILYSAVFILGIFESFFMILSYFNSYRFDEVMAGIDYRVFGVNPTVWFEQWTHPVLTDTMYLLYLVYFPMPFFIIIWLFRKKKFDELAETIAIFSLAYLGAYIIYFFVPVQGPRFFLDHLQTVPLDGVFLAPLIRSLVDFCEPNKLDAFPSLHTAVVMLSMTLYYRHHKKMFRVFVPISVGILISLIYCRYHYVIDMAAGFTWYLIAYFTAAAIFKKFNHKCFPHFGNGIRGYDKNFKSEIRISKFETNSNDQNSDD
jgi:hypothetical protein